MVQYAWIITNGAKSGICELVGYAIAEHRLTNKKENITALAIAKWGAVKQDTYHPLRKLILEENLSINEVLAKLIGDYMEPLDEVDDIDCFYIPMRNNQIETISVNEQRDRISVDPVERTIRDLFLWSVIMLRKEMCLVLIGHLSARICASLIASKIFKKCAQKYANTINIKTRLLGDANLFEKYAMKKLESCYDYDPVMACGLIIREIHLFGNVTCLQVAVAAENINFMGQPCCNQVLNNIWLNQLQPNYRDSRLYPTYITISVFTLGLLAPLLLQYRSNNLLEASTKDLEIVLAYDLQLWFIKSFNFVYTIKFLGPKIVMLGRMLQAMAFFVCVLFITIVAYGVTSRAMVYYGTFDFDGRQILMNVIYPQYFFIYGYFGNELTNLDAIIANNTTANVPATNGTVASAIATYVLFAFHILFVNILLINLLIAMFK
ncbi:unnamed protein product [Rotaria sp. Silwood1]|nr:unnamed protein product [Rotaria sp. Silwood1]